VKELVLISGKGGTGKTSLTAAFAFLAENKILCDTDVDAANLHLLMDPQIETRTDFQGGNLASIDPERCVACGICRDLCRFNAISEDFVIDEIQCEGCGVCVDLCPEEAIDFPLNTCGQWFRSQTRLGPMVHARLGIGEENSGKLVTLVRQEARHLAQNLKLELIITDAPPGIGCPVIASMGNATALIVVTEPSLSGQHDMQRVLELAHHFKVPAFVCVNKFDINLDQTRKIESAARHRSAVLLGRIPFDPVITEAMVQGKTLFEFAPRTRIHRSVEDIWRKIAKQIITK
jgi:MinD superfamily P-loop ATPase